MADYLQSLDPRSLVILETSLSFVTTPFTAPSYNLPIFLFGVYAQENAESNQSLKLFTGLLGGSALFDIIWMTRNSQNWFIKLITLIVLLLKAPTFLAFVSALRQRGEQFSGLNIRGGDANGPTVWSMPGGFSSFAGGRGGYEDVEAHAGSEPAVQPAAPAPAITPAAPANQAPGGYQTL
ncbi:hypothetical protein M0805_004296 [Coniferiporia weirii]|nr:hypothetical protein M0805_004296 [Coniferiporia weirii]